MKDGSSAIIIHNKKVLLFLRDDKDTIPYPNSWSLVGGQVEDGETFDQTLRRELKEEISYVPRQLEPLGKIYQKQKDKVLTGAIFVSFLDDDEVDQIKLTKDEGQKIEFFALEEIKELKTTPLLKNYLNKYKAVARKLIEDRIIPNASDIGLEQF